MTVLVYREHEEPFDATSALAEAGARLERMGAQPTLAQARDLLVDLGEIEAAVADALSGAEERGAPLVARLREASREAGRLFGRALDERPRAREARTLSAALGSLAEAPLPRGLTRHAAEGFAQYAVYPDMYVRAARAFAREARPAEAVVLGIRGIGTSLSAAVAAALEDAHIPVPLSETVRPGGHPFARTLCLPASTAACLARHAERAHFLIADEGPGLSGSSFASAAQALERIGIPAGRIVFFPSWDADGSTFVSEAARTQWRRHRRYTVAFEEALLRTGALAAPHRVDIGAGRWRRLFFDDETRRPAVHPQHERRKYLLRRGGARTIARFAGLGRHGAARATRAETLCAHGWGPAPLQLDHGFLLLPFVAGRPLHGCRSSAAWLDTVGRYLAFVGRSFPSRHGTPVEALLEMIETNAAEAGLSPPDALRRLSREAGGGAPAALDARMQACEWLATDHGFAKTDALDHHADHFFPGPADVAWDVAAAIQELTAGAEGAAALAEAYRRHSGDSDVHRRLPFYRAAYAAFRLGYATMAAQTLGASPDGARFGHDAGRWRQALAGALGVSPARPSRS